MFPSRNALLIAADPDRWTGLRHHLESMGWSVYTSATFALAKRLLMEEPPTLVFTSHGSGDFTALDVLTAVHNTSASIPVIVLNGRASAELATRAVFQLTERAIDNRRRAQPGANVAAADWQERGPFVGRSAAIRRLEASVRDVLGSTSPILILGETGVGKTLLARWIHQRGPRAGGPFVDQNCAGLSTELFESEFFGHARGSFTGAVADKPGLVHLADQGTIFLDEIGDLPLGVQSKILKFIDESWYRRVGDPSAQRSDARLMFATHHDLGRKVEAGLFRGDLFYRISPLVLHVPPLRERPEDIGPIAEGLLRMLAESLGVPPPSLSPGARRQMEAHAWPGNIRELRNVLERALLRSRGKHIEELDIQPLAEERAEPGAPLKSLQEVERQHIATVLRACQGKVDEAARILGISRSSLYSKVKQLPP